jgi:hypothetical protein
MWDPNEHIKVKRLDRLPPEIYGLIKARNGSLTNERQVLKAARWFSSEDGFDLEQLQDCRRVAADRRAEITQYDNQLIELGFDLNDYS